MRQKIYSVFSNVDDAKQALGSIKKASLNQADLTVVFAEDQENPEMQDKNNYEFGAEHFGSPFRDAADTFKHNNVWPGLQTEKLAGVGKIHIGSSNIRTISGFMDHDHPIGLAGDDLDVITKQVKANKVVAVIDAEVELIPRVRLILETHGAEILSKLE